MTHALSDDSLDQIFRTARSHNVWTDEAVSPTTVQAVYDLARWGATTANTCPARFVFLASPEAKARLKPHLLATNVDKAMSAPVLAIIAYDIEFYEKTPQLFPHNPGAKDWFSGDAEFAEQTAFRNGSLQGAYLMIAARALGLDCGPMSGFDNAGVDKEFFDNTTWKSNFICCLGHGNHNELFPRSPRLSFEEACLLL